MRAPKPLPQRHENGEKVSRYGLGKKNGVPIHPNQAKVTEFVESFGVSKKLVSRMRDAVSYARATKTGGWRVRDGVGQRLCMRDARIQINKWDARYKERLGELIIKQVVDFVYKDSNL